MSSAWTAVAGGAAGVVGSAVGAAMQAYFARRSKRERRQYEDALQVGSKLRSAATSVDYVVRPLLDGGVRAEPDAPSKAKHVVYEVGNARAGSS